MTVEAFLVDRKLVGILGGQCGDVVLKRVEVSTCKEPAFRSLKACLDHLAEVRPSRQVLHVGITRAQSAGDRATQIEAAMQVSHAISFEDASLECRDEGRQDLGDLAVANQRSEQLLVGRLLGVVDQLLDRLCTGRRLLGVGQIEHWQAHQLIEQTLQLRTGVRIELHVIECSLVFGQDLPRILGFGFPVFVVLVPGSLLKQELQHLNDTTGLDGCEVRLLLVIERLLHFHDFPIVHGHATQLDLDDQLEAGKHQAVVQIQLVVLHHGWPVLVLHVVGGQGIHQVVLEQLVKRNLADVFDVVLGPVACELVSQ